MAVSRGLLLPGMGGRASFTLALTSGAGAVGTDEFDCSRMAQVGIQVSTWASGNLSVTPQQSFDGVSFADMATATVMVAGDILRLPITTGPFGIIRLSVTSADTSATVTFVIVGYPMQGSN